MWILYLAWGWIAVAAAGLLIEVIVDRIDRYSAANMKSEGVEQ